MVIGAVFGELEPLVGTSGACAAVGRFRASHYRHLRGPRLGPPGPRPTPPNALSGDERATVLDTLHSERFVDRAPAQVWSYDATALRGPRRGVWYDLFMMLDIFSRYCPGWMVIEGHDAEVVRDSDRGHRRESGSLRAGPPLIHAARR